MAQACMQPAPDPDPNPNPCMRITPHAAGTGRPELAYLGV